MIHDDSSELDYYRAVEDLFSTLRGVPHVLSPKDFQLVRSWWKDQIPLSAIRTGVTEVFARRRDRGDQEPVVSLSYCRHAVQAHAKRLADMRVGAPAEAAGDSMDVSDSIRLLARRLMKTAKQISAERPRAAAVIDRFGGEVLAAADLENGLHEEHLYALEASLLIDCLAALEDDDRRLLEERAREESEGVAATPDARERTFRALRDRFLRELLDLPRLEVEV